MEYSKDPMMELFVFETNQLLEQLEQIIIDSEKSSSYSKDTVDEIFRIMHTIKGSSAVMQIGNITALSHVVEDLFQYIREENPQNIDYLIISDIVIKAIDFIKSEICAIGNGTPTDTECVLIEEIKKYLDELKGNIGDLSESLTSKKRYKAEIRFEDDCDMEHMRAFALITSLKEVAEDISHAPNTFNASDANIIKEDGLLIWFSTDASYEDLKEIISKTIFLKEFSLSEIEEEDCNSNNQKQEAIEKQSKNTQNFISVNIAKLDSLMDLVGELVISESMVTQNIDLKGLTLDNFQKAARQHRKIIDEVQQMAMSIRMIPISSTLTKMNRIVRDMTKQLSKNIKLEIIGEETEVDKNIIDKISDPLMHLVRNAVDHGIENPSERLEKGKNETGTITIEAKNAGGDVLIIVKDDGRGLDKDRIIAKAKENGLLDKPENELTEKEIYSFIFEPGFSTKNEVTEFSGRGVGIDVVTRNIASVGGSILVDSTYNEGTTFTMKIPLTLAIMDGMQIRVGKAIYTLPIIKIKESFKVNDEDVIVDPEGNEMIMIRGTCYQILRLSELYHVKTDVKNVSDGIIVMIEDEGRGLCLLVDELVGEQQVVVKALPKYINNVKGVVGCTLLGDGSISLILDAAKLILGV